MSFQRLALGVDGGGTKSDAVLIDETGAILGWGRGGTGQAYWAGQEGAVEAYAAAIRLALAGNAPEELWVAGLPHSYLERTGISIPKAHFVHAGEIERGLATALETRGIVVLAGTGAFVAGLTEEGKSVTLDGLGPVLGDYGSGYQIGLAGLRAAMASPWGPERQTTLGNLIPNELAVTSTHDIFHWVYYDQHNGRADIASVARIVARAAEDGDAIAQGIILRAADDISDVLCDVIRRLGIEQADYALVASGSVAQGCRMYWERVCSRALEVAPRLRPVRPRIPPCAGAGLLALKAMGVAWTPGLLARTEETQGSFLPHDEAGAG